MVTIKEVAKKANVSITTVSRVLNNYPIVNKETKKRVLEAVEQLNYVPSIIARGMRNQRTRTVGIIIPDFRNLYYAEWITYAEIELKSKGYQPIIMTAKKELEEDIAFINNIIKRRIDGIIFCSYQEPTKFVKNIKKISNIPIVIMDQPKSNLPVSAVYSNTYKGFMKLTEYLISLGHRNIAMIKAPKGYAVGDNRFQGYLDCLKKNSILFNENLIEDADFTADAGYEAAKRLLKRTKPSAIIGVSDLVSIGAIAYILEAGYKIPEDIAITGYDNISLSNFVTPKLTTVQEPIRDMAITATEILLNRIEKKMKKNIEVVMDVELIIRESTVLKDNIK